MTLVALCGDTHVWNFAWPPGPTVGGLNARATECVAVLGRAIDAALARKCVAFVVLGDVFDGPRPEPPLVAAVQRELARCRAGGCEPVLLVGNHDRASAEPGDHALAPLAPVATVVESAQLLTVDSHGFDLMCLPYTPTFEADRVRMADEECSDYPSAICMHAGIRGPGTPPWLQGSGVGLEDLYGDMHDMGCEVCFAGDWHSYASYLGGRAIQVGTLCPAGFDDEGLTGYGSVVFWEPGKGVAETVEIPGPRFCKAADAVGMQGLMELEVQPTKLYVNERCPSADLSARAAQLQLLVDQGTIAGYKLQPDDAVQVAQARSAAEGARNADNLAGALEAYVKAMPLDELVSREDLLARCRAMLGL